MSLAGAALVHGVDFTSAPRKAKPITIASGSLRGGAFQLDAMETLEDFARFEAWLMRPGPWVAGFDFPFGLPRTAVVELGWPQTLPALARHCRALGRTAFRTALDAQRAARPAGAKFCHRAGDGAARAHSPLKLVNPPVALMFLEGAARLIDAGVSIPGMVAGDPARVALEAYPGFAVRQLFRRRSPVSYKNDAPGKQTRAHRLLRRSIVERISAADSPFGFALQASATMRRTLVADARGDLLDAVLCALQAAWGWLRRDACYGLPPGVDPIEGWIVSVPAAAQGSAAERTPAAQPLEAFG
jgi:hypothetical protein